MSQSIFSSYNIPKIITGRSASYNHPNTERLKIIPGTTAPFRVILGNRDSRPLSIVGLKCFIIFWRHTDIQKDIPNPRYASAEIVFKKEVIYNDPYAGHIDVVLDPTETLLIGQENMKSLLQWSIIFETEDGSERYPLTIGSSEKVHQSLDVDYTSLPMFNSSPTHQ